jgi:hypothetical protein
MLIYASEHVHEGFDTNTPPPSEEKFVFPPQ